MAAVLKWTMAAAVLGYGALFVYDLPMRKLEAAVLNVAPQATS